MILENATLLLGRFKRIHNEPSVKRVFWVIILFVVVYVGFFFLSHHFTKGEGNGFFSP